MSKKARWTTRDIGDQAGRVAVVTGGNSGIGYETVKALAEKGAHVVVAARSAERGQAAVDRVKHDVAGAEVELMLLDLADLDSVRDFARDFQQRYDRLDLLINNAGVMNPPERRETANGFEMQMGTNHLGHFALTLLLMELITKTEGSRVVNVSSSVQNMGQLYIDDLQWEGRDYKGMPAYSASKIANMLFTLELQRRLDVAEAPTITTSAHPGWTATNLQADTPLFRALNPIFAMQPWQGALPTLYAAVAPDARPAAYYGPHGVANMRGYPVANRPAKQSLDTALARELWAKSEELVGVTWPLDQA
ncbi:MAG: oxidoreductase [Gemmatimonadota bacterium]